MTAAVFLVVSVFLACVVEAVEALTIVLAVGTTRGWRSTLQGMAAGLVVLAVVVVVLAAGWSVTGTRSPWRSRGCWRGGAAAAV